MIVDHSCISLTNCKKLTIGQFFKYSCNFQLVLLCILNNDLFTDPAQWKKLSLVQWWTLKSCVFWCCPYVLIVASQYAYVSCYFLLSDCYLNFFGLWQNKTHVDLCISQSWTNKQIMWVRVELLLHVNVSDPNLDHKQDEGNVATHLCTDEETDYTESVSADLHHSTCHHLTVS